MRHTQIYRY